MTFVDIFGGPNIEPSQVSFAAYTMDANLATVWPFEAVDGDIVCASKLGITATNTGLKLAFPPADRVSVGMDVLVFNYGTNPFTVTDFDGNTLGSVASGQGWYFYVTDNTTTAGVWKSVQFGTGTSSASAASLAGAGLRALSTRLDQNLVTTPLLGDYALTQNDRATVVLNNNGSVDWTFDACASLGNGWFVYVINAGTGTITLTPNGAETIDGSSTKTLNPGESCMVFSDGSNLHTLGFGRALTTVVTGTSIDLSGSGVLNLTGVQIAAQVQDFNGTLTGARIVDYGTGVGYWFVRNNTTGAFSTTFRSGGSDPGVIVPQGSFSILRSNGSTMSIAFSATTGTVTLINTAAGELTGGPITSTGTLGLANTAVAPGAYGDADSVPVFTVDGKGRLTAAAQVDIAITLANVAAFSSADLAGKLTDETGTGLVVFNNAPTLINPIVGTQAPGDNSTKGASTAYVDAAIAALPSVSGFSTGDTKTTLKPTLDAGWLFLDGRSIGSAASGATARANADTAPLFTFMWNTFTNTQCPVSGGRGANAAADFAANKTLTLLDASGAVQAGADDMSGTNRGNLGGNSSVGGITGVASLGVIGGAKDHVQTVPELALHAHTQWTSGSTTPSTGGGAVTGVSNPQGLPTGNAGSSTPFNVTQRTLVCNIWVKM